MTLKVRDSGATSRTITRIRVRDASGTMRDIQRVRGRDASSTLRTLWTALALSLNTTYVDGYDSGISASGNVVSSTVTVSASGVGPFTYSWRLLSGSSSLLTIDTPAGASTTFSGTIYSGVTGTAVCDVTDTGTGVTKTSDPVDIYLEYIME
jgi:hypothetical protein